MVGFVLTEFGGVMLYLEHTVLSSYCDSFSLGLQNLTQISTLAAEEA